jgi:hypothetical protein
MIKQDTVVLVTKGLCYIFIGAGTPMGVSLAQWANTGGGPSKIQWWIIWVGAATGAATQLLSYLSGTYSDYVKGRTNGATGPNDTTQFLASKMASQQQPKTQ